MNIWGRLRQAASLFFKDNILKVAENMLKKFRIPKIPSILLWLVTPALSFFLLETLTHSVAEDMELPLILLNLVFYYLLYGLILAVSKRS